MKKTLLYILLLAVSMGTSARNRWSLDEDNYHFGYVSAGAGYTSLSYKSGSISVSGDVGFLAGIGYEFRRHNLWLSAGMQFENLRSSLRLDEYVYTPPVGGMDDIGRKVNEYHYTVNQEDAQSWMSFDIPIMVGYYNNGFYIGAGFKAAFPIQSKGTVRGTYDIDAVYDKYVGTVSDMHYYKTYPYAGDRSYNLKPMVSVIGEVGYDFMSLVTMSSTICHMLKLGMYFEYGLNSIQTSPVSEPLTINPENITDVQVNPYFATNEGTSYRTVPFLVGIKLTYMIGGSRSATATWHKGCQCYGY